MWGKAGGHYSQGKASAAGATKIDLHIPGGHPAYCRPRRTQHSPLNKMIRWRLMHYWE